MTKNSIYSLKTDIVTKVKFFVMNFIKKAVKVEEI